MEKTISVDRRPRRRVVLVPLPMQGHINPMLQLAAILHSKGFSITVAHTTLHNFPNPSAHPLFRFLPIAADGLSDADFSSGNIVSFINALNANCRSPLLNCLRKLELEPSDDETTACVIYDGLMYFSAEVAENLKIPSIILRTNSVTASLAYMALPRLHQLGFIPRPRDSSLEDRVPELDPLRFKDLPESNPQKLEGILKLVASAGNVRASSAIIYNTIDFLEELSIKQHQKHYQIPAFPIGPFHKLSPAPAAAAASNFLKEDASCLKWLDGQSDSSVLYVSFGSTVCVSEEELAELACGLASSDVSFLWVLRPGLVSGSARAQPRLPEGFTERVGGRGCMVGWAPQSAVLAHRAVGGFLSHCGWNSTMESVCEGVPVICRPVAGDQRVNARILSHVWRVGLELENGLERGEVERAARRVMVGGEGEEMRKRASVLKEKAAVCTKEGGSSCRCLDRLVDFMS